MEIVIKIDDERYKDIQRIAEVQLDRGRFQTAEQVIANGIPLPKRHGRLIDADALKKDDEVTEWLSLNAVRTGKMLKRFSELYIKKIDATPTIIEADKESEVDE